MENDFTKNLFIKSLYNETDLLDELEIKWAIEEDPTLVSFQKNMEHSKCLLGDVQLSPSLATIQNVLKYSEGTTLEATI